MNDYLGTSHEAIYEMVRTGEPGLSQTWAGKICSVSRDLGSQLASLRDQWASIGSVWSDGFGSVRLTAELGAVIDYLQVLADGLSGQSASYADITVQAAADLSAAQPPSALPPPPATSPATLSAKYRQIASSPLDQAVKDAQVVQVANQIAANQAAWLKAGETATTLDNEYRTALARLTPPPEPPPIVVDAAAVGAAVDPGAAPGSVAAGAVSDVGSALRAAPAPAAGGWSVDRYLPGGSTAGALTAGQSSPGNSSQGQLGLAGTVESGGIIGTGGATNSTGNRAGSPGSGAGAGFGPAGVTGSGVADWSGGGVIWAGVLAGGGSALGQRPGIDPGTLHGGSSAGWTYGSGTAGAGAGNAAPDSPRGIESGTSGTGSNSMVQGGQIGQTGRAVSGAAGVGTGRPSAAGSGIGGQHGYRVTWLVEDRDLYVRGPSVKSVIEVPPDAERPDSPSDPTAE